MNKGTILLVHHATSWYMPFLDRALPDYEILETKFGEATPPGEFCLIAILVYYQGGREADTAAVNDACAEQAAQLVEKLRARGYHGPILASSPVQFRPRFVTAGATYWMANCHCGGMHALTELIPQFL